MMNKKTANVLIIDDHPTIIEAFERTLEYIAEHSETLNFKIDSATDCKSAYHKLQGYKNSQNLDLVILDISLPSDQKLKLQSGDDLGILIRKLFPYTKILVITSYTNSLRIRQTMNLYNPKGFLNKQDIDFTESVYAIHTVLSGEAHYSKTIVNAIMQKALSHIQLDMYDI